MLDSLDRHASVAVLLGVGLLLASVAGSATVSGAVLEAPSTQSGSGVFGQTTPANTTTPAPRHRDPATVDEAGDLPAVQSYLAARLTAGLREGTIRLSNEQYQLARERLGGEYGEDLTRYVTVADETAGSDASETFRAARETQRNVTSTAQQYRETYRRYRAARAAGEERDARRLARRLERLETGLARNATRLQRDYRVLENATGVTLTETAARISTLRQNVTARQSEVREEAFLETTLTVRPRDAEASFARPLTLTGRLTAENDSAVVNRTISVAIAGDRREVQTNATGAFELRYRPTTIAVSTSEINVSYDPIATAPYLGTTTAVPVAFEQVTPTLTVEMPTSPVGYGQRVRVRGRVSVAGQSVANVPITVRLEEGTLGHARTGPDGTFRVEAPLGLTPLTGTREASARIGRRGMAIGPEIERTSFRIVETPTTIEASVTRRESGGLRIDGRLASAEGRAVPRQAIAVRVNDTAVTSAVTGPDGQFSAAIPRSYLRDRDAVRVTLRFDGSDTNLASTDRSQVVSLVGAGNAGGVGGVIGGDESGWFEAVSIAVGALVFVVALFGARVWYRRQRDESDSVETAASTGAPTTSEIDSQPARTPLAEVRDRFDGDGDRAVIALYGAVRSELDERYDVESGWTHWEVCGALGDRLPDPEALYRLTERYERAAFAPEALGERDADEAFALAQRLVGDAGADGQPVD